MMYSQPVIRKMKPEERGVEDTQERIFRSAFFLCFFYQAIRMGSAISGRKQNGHVLRRIHHSLRQSA